MTARPHRPARLCLAAALAVSAALAAPAAAQEVLAVKGATVRVDPQKVLDKAVILIEDGRIKAVGPNVKVPWNATVIDATGKYVAPAWVLAHGSGGLDRENENMPVTPYLSVLDSVDPVSVYFETARRAGYGTLHILPGNNCAIGGRGMILKPYGKTPEEMAVAERAGMKISLLARRGNRSSHLLTITKALGDAAKAMADLEERLAEYKKLKEAGAPAGDPPKLDPKQEPLAKVLRGKVKAFVYVPGAADVPAALKVMRLLWNRGVLVLGPTCYKAIDLLEPYVRRYKIPLVLDYQLEVVETDPLTKEKKIVCPAAVFARKGLRFAMTTASLSGYYRSGPNLSYYLPQWQIGRAVRNGVPLNVAIAAFTTEPARILGLADRVGRIQPGYDADLQILSAPILEPESVVEKLILSGRVVYDRAKDPRIRHLTGKKTTIEAGR